MIDRELLEILACPVCKAPVVQRDDRIVCTACGRRYPIREGIPVMLADEAEAPIGDGPAEGAGGGPPAGGSGPETPNGGGSATGESGTGGTTAGGAPAR